MAIDPPPPPPKELAILLTAVGHCEKRASRASEKLAAAAIEDSTARAELDRARRMVDQWKADHPDPQMMLI